jgi:hypothetical protein
MGSLISIVFALVLGCSTKDAGDDSGHHADDSATGDDSSPGDDSSSNDDSGPLDSDHDGSPATDDCDDTDADVHPGAAEAVGDEVDSDCDGAELCYADLDGDEYSDGSVVSSPDDDCTDAGEVDAGAPRTDCDDTDAEISPRGNEICDAEDDDEDCNGLVDDADPDVDPLTLLSWHADADTDGYGDEAVHSVACDVPKGTVADATDCDDADSSRYPTATEVVGDEIDSDCDGMELCFADVDGDGYSDGATGTSADIDCADGGEAVVLGDCNDGDVGINPGATEVCDWLNTDEDCDLLVDDADPDVEVGIGSSQYFVDADADGFGDATDPGTWYCDDPSGTTAYTSNNDDCDDANNAAYPDAPEYCLDGIDSDCDGDSIGCPLSASDATFEGAVPGDESGFRVAGAGDVNGDGNADLLIAAPSRDDSAGCAHVVLGPVSGTVDLAKSDAAFVGTDSYDMVAYFVSGAGDLDADGNADVLFPAQGAGDGGTVYVVHGPLSGTLDASDADAALTGEAAYDYAGTAVAAAGDVDGDGNGDVLVGATGYDSAAAYDGGAAYLVLGPFSGTMELASAEAMFTAEHAEDLAGASLSGPGDVDGDGNPDLLIGAWAEDAAGAFAGAVYLISGPVSGAFDLSSADAKLTGEAAGDQASFDMDGAGDMDADGHDDFLVSAPSNDEGGSGAGAAYLLLGPVTASKLVGEETDDVCIWVAGAGDVNGDGSPDVLVGAPGQDTGAYFSGAAYVVLGPVTGTVDLSLAQAQLNGEQYLGRAGAVAGVGDENGDGFADILVGASSEGDAGAAYLVLGRAW